MASETDFVRAVPIASDRYKVIIGFVHDEVVVADSLDIGRADALVVMLRRVIGGFLDANTERMRQVYGGEIDKLNDDLEDIRSVAAKETRDAVLNAVDAYVADFEEARRARNVKSLTNCCRQLATGIKGAIARRS